MKRRELLIKMSAVLTTGIFINSCGSKEESSSTAISDSVDETDKALDSKDSSPSSDNTGKDSSALDPGNSGARTDQDLDPILCEASNPDVEGPFYRQNPPQREELCTQCGSNDVIRIKGKVLDASDCSKVIEGVNIDVWHADSAGEYDMDSKEFNYRGVVKSSSKGEYSFKTIMPGRYKLGDSFRPAHLHVKISASGYQEIITQLYFKGDPYLSPNDPCGATCKSDDSARIIEMLPSGNSKRGNYNIMLKRA